MNPKARRAALHAIAAVAVLASLNALAHSYAGLYQWAIHHRMIGWQAVTWPATSYAYSSGTHDETPGLGAGQRTLMAWLERLGRGFALGGDPAGFGVGVQVVGEAAHLGAVA